MSRKKIGGEDLHDALELGAERKGRSHLAFCYRVWGNETWGLDTEERRKM